MSDPEKNLDIFVPPTESQLIRLGNIIDMKLTEAQALKNAAGYSHIPGWTFKVAAEEERSPGGWSHTLTANWDEISAASGRVLTASLIPVQAYAQPDKEITEIEPSKLFTVQFIKNTWQ